MKSFLTTVVFSIVIATGAVAQHTENTNKAPENRIIECDKVIQTTNYTYLHGKVQDHQQWLAVPLMPDAKAGTKYYFIGGMEMRKFESKELKRTFDEILFLGGVRTEPITGDEDTKSNIKQQIAHAPANSSETYKRTAKSDVKRSIKVERASDGITIAELFSNKENFAGRTVKIRAEVTKYTASIMDKNWIHLQDGTEHSGKFDLVVTTLGEAKLGETVVVEGKVSLNKDFGYGYLFDVMLEDAKVK